ncbi:MAG: UDP-N-acetylmuramate--L-alanine ligase [Candidatus Parcubacteria bacterium]|nr:MAG: UDP-N-acetylmuramate--L-alanine ligase [Candidatus Parcubacteria bacterium]
MKTQFVVPRVVYFVGIGGIGMSALAQWYAARGARVSGSDRDTDSPVVAQLRRKGIEVREGHSARFVPTDAQLVVYSDAVPPDNPEREEARRREVRTLSYFQALGEVSRAFPRVVAVAGSHGKTTTSAMLALALVAAGRKPTAFVGSLVPQFPEGSNLLFGGQDVLVVEACEYRAHIREFAITHLVLTNLEWDHTDYFASEDAVIALFREVIARLPEGGVVVTNPKLPLVARALAALSNGARIVDYTREEAPLLLVPGAHNRTNAQAALAAAREVLGDDAEALRAAREAVADFRGVWRRFERYGQSAAGAEIVDDYAHHPTEIAATLRAAREVFPGRQIVVLFHPHLYSRTRDLFDDFARELSRADEVYLLPIYPARERAEDYPGVSSDTLARAINTISGNARLARTLEDAANKLSAYGPDNVIITMGAGEGYKVARALREGKMQG